MSAAAETQAWWQPVAVALAVALPFVLRRSSALRGMQYTAWIIAAVVAAMIYPAAFLKWGSFDLRHKWLILVVVQTVMFGMGTQMSLRDFAGVMKAPWGVFVAVAGQFLIMPLSGWALTKFFPLPDEIAAGVILIGCCSSGLASNVMCYIAKANLALSITATAITTLLAPIMTPLWMKLLAGRLVEVSFVGMMTEIIKIVIVPIGAALIHDYLKSAGPATLRRFTVAQIACAAAAAGLLFTRGSWGGGGAALGIELAGFLGGAVAFGVLYHQLTRRFAGLERVMPLLSMTGIVYFTTVTTAAGRHNLLLVGGLLFVVAVLHNTAGYVFGYWGARLCRLDRASCRTVAIEVGLQNGGMASGLAAAMGKLGTVGLAAAIFSPWMNISGSLLANFWSSRPGRGTAEPRPPP
ncbi:MAG: bile acid:sodium symporter family protein [Verrucomicrobia bacterium]|nr:bile acid:sodium symporter family protein [Verrucomicrobiota bacterium]